MNSQFLADHSLRITEIFYSLQGESDTVGYPTVFIRLTGCPLRCQYCDTSYAFSGGKKYTLDNILRKVQDYKTSYVCVTGGEPLAQPHCIFLLNALCDLGYCVSLETSGALSCEMVDKRVMVVMDLKTPGSLECDKNNFSNIQYLKPSDQIKFVICDRLDYDWSKKIIEEYDLAQKTQLLFSPSYTQIEPKQLAEWILEDQLPVRFQLQLHKLLWHDTPGH